MKLVLGFLSIILISAYVLYWHGEPLSVLVENKLEESTGGMPVAIQISSSQKANKETSVVIQKLPKSKRDDKINHDIAPSEKESNIEGSLTYGKLSKEDLDKIVSDYNKDLAEGNIPEELHTNMTGLFNSAKEKDWDKFKESVNWLDNIDSSMLNLALLQAVKYDAPFTLIENLLARGAVLTPQITQILALFNNITLAKKLLPFGLDLYTLDPSGQNAISQTLITLHSKEMFDFLLTQNVNVKPSPQGIDPLAQSLNHILNNKHIAVYYIEQLIRYGAPIENSHRQLLEKLKLKNPSAYIALQRVLPELFSVTQ
ncbi:MAG: hypothetical protein HRT37_11435 [Alteromonadaceae bacterium]|nr:hypothetical protein [Alteromonadaceae bacterium]